MFISLIRSGCDQGLCKCSQGALRYCSELSQDVIKCSQAALRFLPNLVSM